MFCNITVLSVKNLLKKRSNSVKWQGYHNTQAHKISTIGASESEHGRAVIPITLSTLQKERTGTEVTMRQTGRLKMSGDTEQTGSLWQSRRRAGTKAHAWAAVWRIICMTWLVGQRCGRCLRLSLKRKQIRRQTPLCDIAGDLMSDNEGDEALWWLIIITSPNALQSLPANDLRPVWLAGLEHDEESLIKIWTDYRHDLIGI